ncbi:RloB domain-containing protein [Sphingobacteriales bacterium UPWRP_1]|nr:hypothetical protein BVG80_13825 [Sphingobacteriales bacterium TSM_CSM]PSJ77059.1 RloB domain-containing protein [Sphingobacteriales bacterium UPWRP_1]
MGKENKKKAFKKIGAGFKRLRPSIIIVCEGETEKHYFNKRFNFSKAIVGKGQRDDIVEYAKKKNRTDDYDIVWCVFDRDYTNESDNTKFDKAIELAKKEKIETAWSNDAFELWICLHYRNYNNNTPIHRTDYVKELNRRVGKYEKGDAKLYEKLIKDPDASEKEAIERSKKLHKHFMAQTHLRYCEYNPCTTVYLLIEYLEKNLQADI